MSKTHSIPTQKTRWKGKDDMQAWKTVFVAVALLTALQTGLADEKKSEPVEKASVGARFFSQCILLGAHRGGRHVWPENTVLAFSQAAARWPDVLLEGDLLLSRDGEVVVIHDLTVDRTTNGQGLVSDLTLEELKQLDAASHFTTDGGLTYPYRGTGVTIPTLKEALAAAPNHLFLFEMKEAAGIAEETVQVIRDAQATDRCILASVSPLAMRWVRDNAPEIATCYDYVEAMRMLTVYREGDWEDYAPVAQMLAISTGLEQRFNITDEEVNAIRKKGILYLVFTVNDRKEMKRLLLRGIDCVLTDYPDVLEEVIQEVKEPSAPAPD